MTISTTAADARARSRSIVAERFNAVSSTFGPVSPDVASAFAFLNGLSILGE